MANKQSGCVGTIVTAVFTSVVAPVLVHFVCDRVKEPEEVWAPATKAAPCPVLLPPKVEPYKVLAEGVGRTPDEALRDAFQAALHKAAEAVGAETSAREWQAFCQALPREGKGLARCEYLKCWRACERGQDVYRQQVVVLVEPKPLLERLKAAGARAINGRAGEAPGTRHSGG